MKKYLLCVLAIALFSSLNAETLKKNLVKPTTQTTIGTYQSTEVGDYYWIYVLDDKTKKEISFNCEDGCPPFDNLTDKEMEKYKGKKVEVKWVSKKIHFPEGGETRVINKVLSVKIILK